MNRIEFFFKWEDELNFVPRKICRPCACKFPISTGTVKYSAWIFPGRVDVRGRHLWPREISISSYYSRTCFLFLMSTDALGDSVNTWMNVDVVCVYIDQQHPALITICLLTVTCSLYKPIYSTRFKVLCVYSTVDCVTHAVITLDSTFPATTTQFFTVSSVQDSNLFQSGSDVVTIRVAFSLFPRWFMWFHQ
jgi:hypothetical protein